MCTRLSAATFVPNKNKDTIPKAIFRIWIAVYAGFIRSGKSGKKVSVSREVRESQGKSGKLKDFT